MLALTFSSEHRCEYSFTEPERTLNTSLVIYSFLQFGRIPGILDSSAFLDNDLWNKHYHLKLDSCRYAPCCWSKTLDPLFYWGADTNPKTFHTCAVCLQSSNVPHKFRLETWFAFGSHSKWSLCIIWQFSHDVSLKKKIAATFHADFHLHEVFQST